MQTFRKALRIAAVVVAVAALVWGGWRYHDSALADSYVRGVCEGLSGGIYTIDSCVGVR